MSEFIIGKFHPVPVLGAKTKGLTLIEVMLAMAVFSVGILAAASMQTNGMRSMVSARQRLYNTTAAAGRLEMALAMGYDHAMLAAGDHGPAALSQSASWIEWAVAQDSPVPGTKIIRVMVRRPARGGITKIFFV